MESLFFNTPNQCYQIKKREFFEQVDISNGILFFDINTKSQKRKIDFKYIDKMLFIVIVEEGKVSLRSSTTKERISCSENATFINNNSSFELIIQQNSRVFALFIADFFLKRYLSFHSNEPIDFIYTRLQKEKGLVRINKIPLDAFSSYLVHKIKESKVCHTMQGLTCMYRCLEFLVHNLSMLDIIDSNISEDTLKIAKRAKDILLRNYVSPPTIPQLAKLCATNEFTLKKSFKSVYKTTIYSYIQKLRLKRANLLLKEGNLSIKEVASSVGYNHSGYFAKLFFKTYGVYPKDISMDFKNS